MRLVDTVHLVTFDGESELVELVTGSAAAIIAAVRHSTPSMSESFPLSSVSSNFSSAPVNHFRPLALCSIAGKTERHTAIDG